jgi:FkbM family methyltransferase
MPNMFKWALTAIATHTNRLGDIFHSIGNAISRRMIRSRVVESGADRSLYRTKDGDYFWLNATGYIDHCLVGTGVFEPWSTQAVSRLVTRGNTVLDVGANIGYYTVLLSKLVSEHGRVICFEPTLHYGRVLEKNVIANNLNNVEIHHIGLSNKQQELLIQIGESSATLHVPGKKELKSSESIQLVTLDKFLTDHPLSRIDFIKIDVDGHEPHFFEGAWNTLEKFEPIILLEISHPHYLEAGYTAWDFYELLKGQGYYLYHEEGLTELIEKEEFLRKCGNFAYSANIIISKKRLN